MGCGAGKGAKYSASGTDVALDAPKNADHHHKKVKTKGEPHTVECPEIHVFATSGHLKEKRVSVIGSDGKPQVSITEISVPDGEVAAPQGGTVLAAEEHTDPLPSEVVEDEPPSELPSKSDEDQQRGSVQGSVCKVESTASSRRSLQKIEQAQAHGRRQGVSAAPMDDERRANWTKPHFEKEEGVRRRLQTVIRTKEQLHVLFGHLNDEDVLGVIDAMFPVEVAEGQSVICQGQEGDNFYIVDTGSFDVFVRRGDGEPSKVMEAGPGTSFGELALMYNAPRAATVTATSVSTLWALDRDTFQMMLCTAENIQEKENEGFLAEVELLKALTKYELSQLSDKVESELFDEFQTIVEQGQTENCRLYILEDGEAQACISGDQGEVQGDSYSVPGQYFGELALLAPEAEVSRRASVKAGPRGCSVLSVRREDVDSIEPLRAALVAAAKEYPTYEELAAKASQSPAAE